MDVQVHFLLGKKKDEAKPEVEKQPPGHLPPDERCMLGILSRLESSGARASVGSGKDQRTQDSHCTGDHQCHGDGQCHRETRLAPADRLHHHRKCG